MQNASFNKWVNVYIHKKNICADGANHASY